MANKKYNEFVPGLYDTAKIFLQADATSGALEKINLPLIPDSSLLVPYENALSNVNLGAFELQSSKLFGGTGINDVLNLQGTSGIGSLTSPAIKMLVGNDGATNAITILNNGNVGIGIPAPLAKLNIFGKLRLNNSSGYSEISTMENGSIYFQPSNGNTYFNALNRNNRFFAYDYISGSPFPYLSLSAHNLDLNLGGNLSYGLVHFVDNGNSYMTGGNFGLKITNPTAVLHLAAGTAAPNTAPLKLTAGTLLTAVEEGAIEWDGTNLYISQTGIRKQIAYGPETNQKFGDGDVIATSIRSFATNNFPFYLIAGPDNSSSNLAFNDGGTANAIDININAGSGISSTTNFRTNSFNQTISDATVSSHIEQNSSTIHIFINSTESTRLEVNNGQIFISTPHLNINRLADYATNAIARTAGLNTNDLYQNAGTVMVVTL